MDVEKRTVISAGMDASGVTSGMAGVTSDAAKMAAGVTQSVAQISRSLLDSKAGFDALAKNFVDGYRNAQNFAQAIQTAYRSLGTGNLGEIRDKLGLLPQILDNISAKYGVFGEAARQAALKMIDATATQAQRLQAFQSLIASAGGQAASTSSAVPGVAPNVAIVEAYNTALTALQAKYSPLTAAAQTYQVALTGIASAESVGAISATEAGAARDRASASYRTATVAVAAQTAALQAEHEAANRQMLGITDPNADVTAKRAADVEAYGKTLDDLKGKYVPLFAAHQQYQGSLADISRLLKMQEISETEAATATKQATVTYNAAQVSIDRHSKNLDSLTNTTWSQQFAMRQLGVQTVQTFSGFATGQPIFMTLIQQGHQMVDIMFSAGVGLKALAAGIWDFTKALLSNPITLFIIGIIALTTALVTLVAHAQTAAQRIGNLQNQFRASRGDAEAMAAQTEAAARHLAQTTSLGFTEASKAAADFAKNPAFQGTQQQQEALVNQAHKLAIVLGGDLPAATKILVRGMDDAAGAAKTLLDEHHFGAAEGVTQAWVDSLKQMNQAQAFQALSDKIAQVTRGAKENFTDLGQAWQDFQKLLSGGGPGVWTEIGNNIADGLAVALRAINAIIEAWQHLTDNVASTQSQLKAQGGAIVGGSTIQQQLQQWSLNTFYGGRQAPATPSTGGALVGEQHYAGMFTAAETQYGLPPGLLSSIAKRESGYDPMAVNKQSGAGGMMQLLESSARQPGYGTTPITSEGRFDPQTSIQFAGQYISNVAQKLGSLDAAIKVYSGGGYSAASLGVSPGTGVVQTQQQTIAAAQAGSTNALSARLAQNQADQDKQRAGIEQSIKDANVATLAGDKAGTGGAFDKASAQAIRYAEALDILKGAATDIISEQDKLARSATDAIRPLNTQAGAARSLAEVENQFRIAARSANGGIVDQTALNTALSAKQQELTNTANDHVRAMDRQTNMTNALTTATEQGGAALDHARNFEQAWIDVQATSTAGTTEQARQIVALTEAMDRNSDAKRTNAAATDIAAMTKEQELLAAEARLIGESTMAREQELAVIRQRQSYGLAAGDLGNAKQQEAIEQRRITAGQIVQNKELEVNYNELASATSQSFQTIGDAIAQAFVSGEGAAVSFQNVFKAVISQVIQEMIKLSIINPILKSLFPGQQTSGLATAGGVLGAMFGGGGGFAGGGALGMSATGGMSEAIGGGLFASGGIFAKGGVFYGSPSLSAFSNSIVASPTLFDTGLSGFRAYAQGGIGLAGEAGPEAILPLKRAADGSLGIRGGGGGGGTSVVVNSPITINSTGAQQGGKPMDPAALKQLQQTIDLTVTQAVRKVIVAERRPGGDLYR